MANYSTSPHCPPGMTMRFMVCIAGAGDIVKIIICPRLCYLMISLSHIGLDVGNMKPFDTNLIIYKDPKDTLIIFLTDSDMDDFHGFMTC